MAYPFYFDFGDAFTILFPVLSTVARKSRGPSGRRGFDLSNLCALASAVSSELLVLERRVSGLLMC